MDDILALQETGYNAKLGFLYALGSLCSCSVGTIFSAKVNKMHKDIYQLLTKAIQQTHGKKL